MEGAAECKGIELWGWVGSSEWRVREPSLRGGI